MTDRQTAETTEILDVDINMATQFLSERILNWQELSNREKRELIELAVEQRIWENQEELENQEETEDEITVNINDLNTYAILREMINILNTPSTSEERAEVNNQGNNRRRNNRDRNNNREGGCCIIA